MASVSILVLEGSWFVLSPTARFQVTRTNELPHDGGGNEERDIGRWGVQPNAQGDQDGNGGVDEQPPG